MSAAVIAPYVAVAAGVNSLTGGAITNAIGLTGGGSGGGTGSGSSGQYDPYAPYRAGDAAKMQELMNNPALAMSDPGYAQQLQTGIQTTNRGMAASGQLQSGQEQIALNQVGQNTFGSYYQNKLANLMQTSGASQNPAAASYSQQLAKNAQLGQMNTGMGQIASGLGGIANIYNSTPQTSAASNFYGGGISNTDLGGYGSSTYSGVGINPSSSGSWGIDASQVPSVNPY